MKTKLSFLFTVSLFAILFLISKAVAEQQNAPAPDVTVVRLDPRFDKLIPPNAAVEKIAEGFTWIEGPVWDRKENSLLFSDIPYNSIFLMLTDFVVTVASLPLRKQSRSYATSSGDSESH